MPVVMKKEIEEEGYQAHLRGETLEDNPYYERDFKSLDWAVGWKRAEKEYQNTPEIYGVR